MFLVMLSTAAALGITAAGGVEFTVLTAQVYINFDPYRKYLSTEINSKAGIFLQQHPPENSLNFLSQ